MRRSKAGVPRRLWSVLVAVLLLAAACGSGDTTTTTVAGSETTTTGAGGETTTTAEGGETTTTDAGSAPEPLDLIRWAGPGPVTTLDGSVAGDAASMIGIYFTSGQLTRFNADRVPVLDLAESVEFTDDGLSATVTLHEGLVYSDGTPVQAEDIQYAVERNREGTGASFVATVDTVEVVDDRTAIIHLKGPDPDLLSWFAERGFQLHPKELVEADPEGYWTQPVSAGPYVVEAGWSPGSPTFRAVENESYHKGPMMARAIEHVAVPDVPSRILQLNSGELDMAYDLPLASVADLDDDVETLIAGVGGMNYVVLNHRLGGPFASQEVRQAISLAIDRQRVSNVAFWGLQPAATSPLFDCGDLCEPNLLPHAGAQNLDEAKALMESAGYADGFSATMKVSSGRGGWPDAAVLIAEDLEAINIEIEIEPVDEGQHYSSIGEGNFEMFFSGGGGHHQATIQQMLAPGGFWIAAAGAEAPEGGPELVALTSQTIDPDARRGYYTQAQELWAEHLVTVSVVERMQLSGHRIPNGILIPQVKNDQKIIIQSVAEATAGARAGDL